MHSRILGEFTIQYNTIQFLCFVKVNFAQRPYKPMRLVRGRLASGCGDEGAREAGRGESAEGAREKEGSKETTAILTQRCRRGALLRLCVVCYGLISFSPDSKFAFERGRTNSLAFKATEE